MNALSRRIAIAALLVLAFSAGAARAQLTDPLAWAASLKAEYKTHSEITYLTANNWEGKLDLYLSRNPAPNPTLVYFHGGGWQGGLKQDRILELIPYLVMGWSIVNVEYRAARVSLAPAAVEDCRCALAWVYANAKKYNFDTTKIVVTGSSAGGHLALTTGMLPESAGLDRQCPSKDELKVAAIINWFGVTDVVDLLDGPNMKEYAVGWLGSQPDREAIAKRVSPLTYVRAGLPPILTIHGDADPAVPYTHAVRLQQALNKAGVPNELLMIPGGQHGGFSREEMLRIYGVIQEFLRKHDLVPKPVEKSATR